MAGGRLVLGALVLASAFAIVLYHSNESQSIALEQARQARLSNSPDAEFDAEYRRSEKLQAIDSETGAAKINARFGGSFNNGVGSNTWKGTPWSKYDAKAPRKEMLAEESLVSMPVSPEDELERDERLAEKASSPGDAAAPRPTSPDDPSEMVVHASEEGVGIEGGRGKSAESADPDDETPKSKAEKATKQKAVIAACVKACTMPICVQACNAIGDPQKLDDMIKHVHQPRLQQKASMQAPGNDWQSFVKKCEDTCKIEACKQMCRAAGAKERNALNTVMHFDPATTDEVTGKVRDETDVETASSQSSLSPILPPPLPPGVKPPSDDTMMARGGASSRRPNVRIIDKAPLMQLAQKEAAGQQWFDSATFEGKGHEAFAAPLKQKVSFWEGLGDEKDRPTSQGRSDKPITAAARKPAALAAPTQMLAQENADPYYVGGDGPQQASDGGNPYAKGWNKVKGTNLDQINAEIDQQLQPLAQEYPYLRSVRH